MLFRISAMNRRGLVTLSFLLVTAQVAAQGPPPTGGTYPTRAVRFLTPVPGGATGDLVARGIARKLSEAWGQPVVVEPRPGAGMIVATELAAKAPPDGYTLLLVAASFSVNPSLHSKLPYDTLRDFAPISHTTSVPYVLVVHPTLPVKSVAELVALAKAKPSALNYGAAGTQNQLAMELFKLRTGTRIVHVPYRGASLAITDLVAGQIQLALGSTVAVGPQVSAGKLRALAVTSARRASPLPNVPTLGESGLAGFDVSAWTGVVVPSGVPAAIVTKLNRDIVSAIASPELRDRLVADGAEAIGSSPDEFTRFIRAEMDTWAKVVRAAGVRAE